MKWPWVSRARLELAEQVIESARELEAEAQRQRARLEEDKREGLLENRQLLASLDKWRQRAIEMEAIAVTRAADIKQLTALLDQSQNYVAQHWIQNQALTKVIVELKKVGFEQPVNPADITTDAPLPNAVEEAIDQRAAAGTELHRALQKYARAALRREGATEDLVAQEIIKGASEEVFELL